LEKKKKTPKKSVGKRKGLDEDQDEDEKPKLKKPKKSNKLK